MLPSPPSRRGPRGGRVQLPRIAGRYVVQTTSSGDAGAVRQGVTLRGIDVSNYATVPTPAVFASLVNGLGLRSIVIACQYPATWAAWYELAEPLGLRIDAYRYLYNAPEFGTYDAQTRNALGVIEGCRVSRLWLDVEDEAGAWSGGQNPPADAAEQLAACSQLWPGYEGFYSRADYWINRLGNPQLAEYGPLWDASYRPPSQLASYQDNFDVNYGGWLRCQGRQYAGSFTLHGVSFGLDSWDL